MPMDSATVNRPRRTLLVAATIGFGLVGLGITAFPFFKSLALNDVAQSNHEMEVSLGDIPSSGVKEVLWGGRSKVFLVMKNKKIAVFQMPYLNSYNAVGLPDITWNRAYIPCHNFILRDEIFHCADPEYNENPTWRWTILGKSLTSYIPDMQIPVYVVAKDHIVLGRSIPSATRK